MIKQIEVTHSYCKKTSGNTETIQLNRFSIHEVDKLYPKHKMYLKTIYLPMEITQRGSGIWSYT